MKLSEMIIKEHGLISVEYIKKRDKNPRFREEYDCSVTNTLRDLTQAYKDALFMEGELSKFEEDAGEPTECGHEWTTSYNIKTNKHDSLCGLCGATMHET